MDDVKEEDAEDKGGGGEGDGKAPALHAWYLVDADNKKLLLPRTMLFLGRDECDIIIESGTVDKRHAVITFDLYLSRFKVKDLSTTNGTYVNESRIPEQEYVTLNHMDSIRLGYDSKVYHMEQGELCGDSPPPPPLPLQPPPLLTEVGSQHLDDLEEPVWVSHHADKLAECQGCIAEQKIEHTCTHAHPKHSNHDDPQFVDVQRQANHSCCEQGPGRDLEPEPLEPEPDPDELEPQVEPEMPRLGRNTWPRKKVRQVAHVASIFDADEDSVDGGAIVVESGSNYFVSVDDSVCGGGRLAAEYSLSRAGSVHRILRNSKQPLPPELATVKKGTPLYGQPAWWGEDTETNGDPAMEPQGSSEHKTSRPSSLVVQAADDAHHPQPQHAHKDSRAVYMEIPHQAATPERDKPPSGRDKSATPARSLTSSISKDSLVLSPADSARERSADRDGDAGGRAAAAAAETSSNPALSFTVDFGDERKPKLKSGASLSEFVPTKIRNSLSFHARSEKAPSALSAKGRESLGSRKNSEERDLSPVRQKRLDEVWGGTDVASKGKSTRRSSGQATGVASLRSSDFASEVTPVVVERSKECRKEAEKRLREPEKETDKKPPKSPKSQDTRKAPPRAPPTKVSKSKSQSAAATAAAAAVAAASAHAAQYPNTTAYLIDRMFAGSAGDSADSPRSDASHVREGSDSPAAPEHAMYKEAKEYDRASQRGGGGGLTYRAHHHHPHHHHHHHHDPPAASSSSSASCSRPPLHKQKSLSRSPANSGGGNTPRSPVGVNPVKSPRTPPSKAEAGPTVPESDRKRAGPVGNSSSSSSSSPPDEPPALPAATSPVGDQEEDKVSEAGTYTIEAEEDGEEELLARQQIDEVFGVDVDSFSIARPVIGCMERLAAAGEEEEEEGGEEGEERTLHEEVEGENLDPGSRTPCDEEGADVFDHDEEETTMSGRCGEDEVPSWISQLNALTAASLRSPNTTKGADRREAASKSLDESSRKPSQGVGLSRKRPGTGRKLPSIPTANDQSPVSSEHSSRLRDNSPDSPTSALNGSLPARLENGYDLSSNDSPSRNAKFSPLVSGSVGTSGKLRLVGSPCDSEDSSQNAVSESAPKGSSICTRGSIDTELLLRDTETVMAAMEARMGFGGDDRNEEDGGSDTDMSSTVAMVNGDEDYVKPSKYHSPRQTMVRKSTKDKDNSNIRIAATSSSSTKKPLLRSYSEQKPPVKGERSARSGAGVSVVSDVLSHTDSLDQSFQSDASDGCSDRTDSSFSRSGSRGKGTITMTKPNRAFALRRARADGTEASEASRGRAGVASPASSRRSSSIHGTTRTPCSDRTGTGTGRTGTGRSEASLGAQIVKKARENAGTSKGRESSVTRTDGARRNSLRGTERRTTTPSSVTSSTLSTVSSAKKERDIRTLKTQLKSAPSNKDLAITGVSSRSHSQPGSRSNSPKAAERMAWKRRKEYDPRKAVAEAKANKTKEPRPKPPKVQSSLYKQRMIRSASFTNSAELSGRVRHDTYSMDSTSSAEDLSSAATAADSYSEAGFRRAFIPFHNPLRGDRLSHSADEDEAGTFPTSQSYDSLIVSSIYQLSLKLKTTTDRTLNKLREQDRVSITPSPIDDFLGHPAKSEIPAWKSANQELAGVLKNLRKMEHHLHLMERALFPDEDTDTDVSGMSSTEKHKYFQEIERIRSELAGFQPIDNPRATESQDPGSPEMAELSKNIC